MVSSRYGPAGEQPTRMYVSAHSLVGEKIRPRVRDGAQPGEVRCREEGEDGQADFNREGRQEVCHEKDVSRWGRSAGKLGREPVVAERQDEPKCLAGSSSLS